MSKSTQRQWIHVALEQLSQEDFLQQQYLYTGFSKLNASKDNLLLHASTVMECKDMNGMVLVESDALADALLSYSEVTPLVRTAFNATRLAHGVVVQCPFFDANIAIAQLKMHILKCIHDALVIIRGKNARQDRTQIMDQFQTILQAMEVQHTERSLSMAYPSLPETQYEGQLELKCLFTMVSALIEEEMDEEMKMGFVSEVDFLLRELHPLALMDDRIVMNHPELMSAAERQRKIPVIPKDFGVGSYHMRYEPWRHSDIHMGEAAWNDALPPGHLLDALQEFLLGLLLPSPSVTSAKAITSLPETENQNASLFTSSSTLCRSRVQERSEAVATLMYLANSRGLLSSFLVVLHLLLDVHNSSNEDVTVDDENEWLHNIK